jgi:hypothetical protein
MSDPRIVHPQRVPAASVEEDACAHRYWCRTRITAVVLLGLLVVAGLAGVWWWIG